MTSKDYQLRIFLDEDLEEALKWYKYKTGTTHSDAIRAALEAYAPIQQAMEEVRQQKETGIK